MKLTWYKIRAAANDTAPVEILLYGEIGEWGVTAADFVADLKKVPADKPIVLRIHSPGGSVFDGQAIITALQAHPGGVTTHVDGLAASMGAIIALVGKPVKMAANAMMMIHCVSGFQGGNADDLRRAADVVEKLEETTIGIITAKTGLPAEEVRAMLVAETWLTAEEAKAKGFVDEITGEMKMAAKYDLKSKRRFDNRVVSMTEEEIAALVEQLTALTARVDALEAQVAALTPAEDAGEEGDEATAKDKTKVQAKATAVDFKAQLATANAAIADLKAKQADALLKATQLAPQLAAEIAASFGVKPAAKAKEVAADQGKADIVAQYAAIKDPTARRAFFVKNKAALVAANNAAKAK